MDKFKIGQAVYDESYGQGIVIYRSVYYEAPYPIIVAYHIKEYDKFITKLYTHDGRYKREDCIVLLTMEEYNELKDKEM